MPRKPRKSGRPTVQDVAAAAGVSAITVSRVLRSPDRVSPGTRARVRDAIRALDYLPDAAASALASRRTDTIGVIVPSVTNSVFQDTLRGLYDRAAESGTQIQIANSRYDPEEEERLIRLFYSQRPAALIVTGTDQSAAAADLLRKAPCPVVQMTEIGPDPYDMMVGFDHGAAAALAARHLVEMGYQRIGFLGGRQDPRSLRRRTGFAEELGRHGAFDPARVLFSDTPSSVACGARQLAELLARDPSADAVLCNNDDLALGVLFECQRRGLAVPERFGICGFNDFEWMAAAYPSLTSIRTPRFDVGRRAMDMALARLADPTAATRSEALDVTLIARDSTARPTAYNSATA